MSCKIVSSALAIYMLAASTALISPVTAAPATALTLTRDGRATGVIVLADAPSEGAKAAAEEFRHYAQSISGAALPIKSEQALSEADRRGTLVLIGASDLTRRAGIDIAALKPEGYVVKTVGNQLILAGREDAVNAEITQQGTSFAVTSLLETALGVHWLWPGASGEVVPRQPTITIQPVDRTSAPALVQRQIRDLIANKNERWDEAKQILGLTPERLGPLRAQSADWLRRQALGSSIKLSYAHAFNNWWEQYHEGHPEYFAMQLNGSRDWPEKILGRTERVKMCVSNPALLVQFTANATKYFQDNPKAISFSASPNDSYYTGHCMCPVCKSWDVARPEKAEYISVDKDGNRVTFEYPMLSDRYAHFYNVAARRLAKVAPGKYIGGIAYGTWLAPPINEKLDENIIVGIVGFNNYLSDKARAESVASWNGWSKKASHFFLRPNTLHPGYGLPLVYVHRLAADLRNCADTGMMAVDFDSLLHRWAAQGLNYYVLVKLLWDPHADVDEIVNDYCKSGFGLAAKEIRAYFDDVEQLTNRLAAMEAGTQNEQLMNTAMTVFTPETITRLQNYLDRAKAVATDDKAVVERILFIEKGLDYTRLQLAAVKAVQTNKQARNPANESAMKQAVAARLKFYRSQIDSFALYGPDLLWREMTRPEFFFGRKDINAVSLKLQENDEQG